MRQMSFDLASLLPPYEPESFFGDFWEQICSSSGTRKGDVSLIHVLVRRLRSAGCT